MNKTQPINNMEIGNLKQVLNLLRSQAKNGHVDLDLLTKQIDKVDGVLDRVESVQQERYQEARFRALYDVSRVIGSSLNLETVLDEVMDAVIKLTGAERGFVMLRDDDGDLSVKSARNFDQQTIGPDEAKFSRTIANYVFDKAEAVLTTNASEDPRFAQNNSVMTNAFRSVMATPLRARGKVIGVAYVDSRIMSGLFKQEDLNALDAFSAQAAVALDNAILFGATDNELARRVDELKQLRRIDMMLSETLDADKAIAFTLEWACRLSDACCGYMGLTEADNTRSLYQYGDPPGGEQASVESLEATYPDVERVIEAESTIRAEDEKGNALLIVPILRESDVAGVVVLCRETPQPFTAEQQDIVERIVTRAAVAIENARLYAAVQEADKAKSEFVGIVAHDLKAPMTAIKGYAEMTLMGDNLEERQRDFTGRIIDTVRRMEMLVSDLADISRIESGQFLMEPIRVPVAEIIQTVKDSSLPQVQSRNHTLVEQVEPDLPDLWVDYYRMMQILTNLVSNACKYTPDGGTVTLAARRKGEDRVEFSVSDTGIGLTAEQIENLGNKFWRADDEYTRSQPGTGLGFSITQHLVGQMGSEVAIRSAPGQGSTFTFDVPVWRGEA